MIAASLAFLLQVAAQGQYPEIVTRSHPDCSRGVDFHAIVAPETVYVGQQATYQLGVFLDQETRSRLRRNPEFLPPESRSMLSYDLPDRGSTLTGTIGGRPCEVHIFRRALFPLTPGRYDIPPARLTYTLPQNPSFFSREESYALRSEAAVLVAVNPPEAGRPADWAGAVGSWHASARVDSSRGRAGDPLVLTLKIEGQGNVTLLPRPPLTIPWAGVVAADERVRLDSTPTALRGTKEFDWLVTPSTSGVQRIPAIRFVYFDPSLRRYEVAQTDPFSVRVLPGDVIAAEAAPPAAANSTVLSIQPSLGDELPVPLGDLAPVRWLLGIAPLFSLGAWLVKRPRRAPRATTPLDRLRSMRDPPPGKTAAAAVRRAFLDGIRQRTGLEASSLAERGAWARELRLRGVRSETAFGVEELLGRLDTVAFGGVPGAENGLSAEAAGLLERVIRESTASRSGLAASATRNAVILAITAITAVTASAVWARTIEDARAPFAQGITAYAGSDFVRAARAFEDAARVAPRSAAAWANMGTASWAVGDTANAVVGWQHALRLDPTAPDLRTRLAQVRAPQEAGPARVIALPARLPSAIAIVLWLVGWALIAHQCWRRRPAGRLVVATLVIAGGMSLAARRFENALEGRSLAVVTEPSALRALPALGADGGAMPLIGEVARVIHRQGVWTQIGLDGGRAGWIASERLAFLGRD